MNREDLLDLLHRLRHRHPQSHCSDSIDPNIQRKGSPYADASFVASKQKKRYILKTCPTCLSDCAFQYIFLRAQ